MIGLDLFVASFAIGVGGTGWLIQGESFPTAVRGQAASLAATVDWPANFALIEPSRSGTRASDWTGSWSVSPRCASLAIALRIPSFLPETKGLSVEEIEEVFEQQAEPSRSAPPSRATGPEEHGHLASYWNSTARRSSESLR